MCVVVLVAYIVYPCATNLRLIQCILDFLRRTRGAILAQSPVEFLALLRIDGICILGTSLIAVLDRVQPEKRRNSIVNRSAERTDVYPPIAALEGVVGLKPWRAVPSMAVHCALASEEGQSVPIRLGYRLILC